MNYIHLISYWLVLQQRKKEGQHNKWINPIIKSDPAWWSYIISRYLLAHHVYVTCPKSLTNFITYYCIKYTSQRAGLELASLVVIRFNNILLYINNRIGQQVIPTYMKSSPYKLYTWINDSKPVVIDTDCIGSCKSNYHTITTTMAPSV